MGSELLEAIEAAALRRNPGPPGHGSDTDKHLYVYGFLQDGPTILNWGFIGDNWSVSGWRLSPFLKKVGPELAQRLRDRVGAELTTTFAMPYTRVIGLDEALRPEVLSAYHRKATGEKFLIDPTRG